MKNTVKTLSLILILFLLVPCLSGCTEKNLNLTASEVVSGLINKGLPIGKNRLREENEKTAEKPTSGVAYFEDTRVEQPKYDLSETYEGGKVLVYKNVDGAKEYKKYLDDENLKKEDPNDFEYVFRAKNILLWLSNQLNDEQAKAYKVAFDEITGVKSEDALYKSDYFTTTTYSDDKGDLIGKWETNDTLKYGYWNGYDFHEDGTVDYYHMEIGKETSPNVQKLYYFNDSGKITICNENNRDSFIYELTYNNGQLENNFEGVISKYDKVQNFSK